MPSGKHKSRTLRRVKRVAPGGRVVTHYKKRKPSKARCSVTGQVLPGVANERPYKMKKMPKTAKRPERPFGGVLSSKAMRNHMKKKARDENV